MNAADRFNRLLADAVAISQLTPEQLRAENERLAIRDDYIGSIARSFLYRGKKYDQTSH